MLAALPAFGVGLLAFAGIALVRHAELAALYAMTAGKVVGNGGVGVIYCSPHVGPH